MKLVKIDEASRTSNNVDLILPAGSEGLSKQQVMEPRQGSRRSSVEAVAEAQPSLDPAGMELRE